MNVMAYIDTLVVFWPDDNVPAALICFQKDERNWLAWQFGNAPDDEDMMDMYYMFIEWLNEAEVKPNE